MPKFNNLDDLENYIREHLKDTLKNEVVQKIKEVEIEVIEKEVYDVYPNPKVYQRRGANEGLLDIRNIEANPLFNGNYYSIKNVTKKYQVNEYLAPLIEYGHTRAMALGDQGYSFPNFQLAYMYPRPFTERTYERLASGKEHVEAMKEGLEKRGLDTK
jgi:hypothetical protein